MELADATAMPACSEEGAREALLKKCTDQRHLSEIMDAFAANIAASEEGDRVESWGNKIGHSLFDEYEALGLPLDFDEVSDEEEDDDVDVDDAELSVSESGSAEYDPMSAVADRACQPDEVSEVPRIVKLMQPLCCVYTLEWDLKAECPICLEPLSCHDKAWRMPCTHTLHEACAMRLFGKRHTKPACPICRCDIRSLAAGLVVAA
mmetsp:Transcript_114329/g.328442  ORF Transcript_114329/g.328442 Transcript_114329/m.328442 type:complete len:206 (+) Transcript_114329:69-686(+)